MHVGLPAQLPCPARIYRVDLSAPEPPHPRPHSRGARLTHEQYDALERAITDGRRIALTRRGTEYVVIPDRLRVVQGREVLDATHPTTGDRLTLYLDEVDTVEPVQGR